MESSKVSYCNGTCVNEMYFARSKNDNDKRMTEESKYVGRKYISMNQRTLANVNTEKWFEFQNETNTIYSFDIIYLQWGTIYLQLELLIILY